MGRQRRFAQHAVCGMTVGVLAGILAWHLPAFGETDALPTTPDAPVIEELRLMMEEETVSIASRYDQPISQSASNVYVITDEDIRHSGATDLPTVLRRIPGMEVMQVTGADFNVSVRGDNQLVSNKMLVMVDGRSIYVDVQGFVFWKAIPITLPEIKRIEVLKGPASAIYGFNAFDGVINIITKSPAEMKGNTLQFGGGELGTISSAAIHAGTLGALGYRLSVGRDQNQQWRNRDALAFRSHKFNIQTEYAFSDQSRLSVSGGLVDMNPFDGQTSQDTVSSGQPAQGYANVTYERPDFVLRAFWNRYDSVDEFSFHPLLAPFQRITDRQGSSRFSTSADTYNIDAQQSVQLGTAHRVALGMNYRHNTMSTNAISQFSQEDRLGFYIQDEWRATSTLTLVAGARYDLDTFINPTISPRATIVYQPVQDHTFRAGFSVAYRPPTIAEKRVDLRASTNPPLPPLTAMIIGGSSLAPEQMVSYEVGYQGWFLRHRLRTRVDLFFNHISDIISTRNSSPTLATGVNDGGSADIYGGEAGLEFLATRWLTGFANYSYQEIGQSFTGRVQRGAPRFKWNAGLRGEWDNGLSSEVAYHYYGATNYPPGQSFTSLAQAGLVVIPDTRVGSYNLLNLRGGYKFWKQKASAGYLREAEVAVSAFNALNDKHKEHPLGDTIGSRVMGWLTVRF